MRLAASNGASLPQGWTSTNVPGRPMGSLFVCVEITKCYSGERLRGRRSELAFATEDRRVDLRNSFHGVLVNLISQVIWVVLVAGSSVTLMLLFGSTDFGGAVGAKVEIPVWLVLLAATVAFVAGVAQFAITRKGYVVRGRLGSTRANVDLLRRRSKVPLAARVIRSTRFGRWPANEVLEYRNTYRRELDAAIIHEGVDVRRIWNISSKEDCRRLREVLDRYRGRTNHSIRAYFAFPDHILPELLVVDGGGASISFPSTRTPHQLDWMIRFTRRELVLVVRDYFDVLWDRAERMLDAGEIADACLRRLEEAESRFDGPEPPR